MRGTCSGREYDPEQAGGPLEKLHIEDAVITANGVDEVVSHLSRFGSDRANEVMVERLRRVENGTLAATEFDHRFYAHERRELHRYRRLGWSTGAPSDPHAAHALWNNAHTAALEEYGIANEKELYHPDARVFL
jgi:hypothetical protein